MVVLYKLLPVGSRAFTSLHAAIGFQSHDGADVTILIYDNTPGGQDAGMLPSGVLYKPDTTNAGLAAAYNYALKVANEKGYSWLLTLDQDTTLPADFMRKLIDTIKLASPLETVAAIVPIVSSDGRIISPCIPSRNWTVMKNVPKGFSGVSPEMVYAINSAVSMRVSALMRLGGYDSRFFADFSDYVMFWRIHQSGLQVFVAGDITVEHELSVLSLKNRTTSTRYEQIHRAEEAFYDEYLGRAAGLVLLLRLFHRLMFKLWRAGASLSYFKIDLRFICRRVFYSRTRRVRSWEESNRLSN